MRKRPQEGSIKGLAKRLQDGGVWKGTSTLRLWDKEGRGWPARCQLESPRNIKDIRALQILPSVSSRNGRRDHQPKAARVNPS